MLCLLAFLLICINVLSVLAVISVCDTNFFQHEEGQKIHYLDSRSSGANSPVAIKQFRIHLVPCNTINLIRKPVPVLELLPVKLDNCTAEVTESLIQAEALSLKALASAVVQSMRSKMCMFPPNGLILLCFIGLYTLAQFPGFSNRVLKSKLSTVPGCPDLSYCFIWGRSERKGGKR